MNDCTAACLIIILQCICLSFSMPSGILYVLIRLHPDKLGLACPYFRAWTLVKFLLLIEWCSGNVETW